ncbi:hypothetical protein M885DRAFT_199722 [Pelagophyceae sp. CCMP2097]|nr:hypothetical protein M885DRAFT_199722 [Pelagophyceae sp. CCMP2097]
MRCLTLVFAGAAAAEGPSGASFPAAAFVLELPKSWEDKRVSKLLAHFASCYAKKHPDAPQLDARLLEVLSLDGTPLKHSAAVSGIEADEVFVAFKARASNAPVLFLLGEVETSVGVVGETEPRATVPTYVKESYPDSLFCSKYAAGGSVDEARCKNPRQGACYYPVGSSGLKYAKRVPTDDGAPGAQRVAVRGWRDVEMIVRHALVRSRLYVNGRHVVVILPSRASEDMRRDVVEMFLRLHGAASVAAVPLHVAAASLVGASGAVCIVDCGHDSSCAVVVLDGVVSATAATLRGGARVTNLFAALVDRAGARHLNDSLAAPWRLHETHLSKKRIAHVRSLDGARAETFEPRRITLADGTDANVYEEARLCCELLFAAAADCPVDAVANAPPLQQVRPGARIGVPARRAPPVRGSPAQVAADAIWQCDSQAAAEGPAAVSDGALARRLFANVVVTGFDDALHAGANARLAQELAKLTRGKTKIRVAAAAAWPSGNAFAARLATSEALAFEWIKTEAAADLPAARASKTAG